MAPLYNTVAPKCRPRLRSYTLHPCSVGNFPFGKSLISHVPAALLNLSAPSTPYSLFPTLELSISCDALNLQKSIWRRSQPTNDEKALAIRACWPTKIRLAEDSGSYLKISLRLAVADPRHQKKRRGREERQEKRQNGRHVPFYRRNHFLLYHWKVQPLSKN